MQTFIKRNVPSHIIIKKSLLTLILSIHQTNHHSITQSQHPAVTLLATVPTAAHTLLQQHAARLPVLTGSPCLHMRRPGFYHTAYMCWFISLSSSGINGSVTSWLLPGSHPPTCRGLENVRRYRSLADLPLPVRSGVRQ